MSRYAFLKEHATLTDECENDRPEDRSDYSGSNGNETAGKELVLKSAREPLTIRGRSGEKTPVKRLVQVKQAKGR
jgi:hypothetical protein